MSDTTGDDALRELARVVLVTLSGAASDLAPESTPERAIATAEAYCTRDRRGLREVRVCVGRRTVARWRAYTHWVRVPVGAARIGRAHP